MSITMAKKRKRKQHELLGGIESAASGKSTLPKNACKDAPIEVVTASASNAVLYMDNTTKKIHFYLTKEAIPKRQADRDIELSRGSCPTCRCGYAYMKNGKPECDECRADRLAISAMEFEQAGINLGWGFSEHTREYERERRGISNVGRLQQDAKEA